MLRTGETGVLMVPLPRSKRKFWLKPLPETRINEIGANPFRVTSATVEIEEVQCKSIKRTLRSSMQQCLTRNCSYKPPGSNELARECYNREVFRRSTSEYQEQERQRLQLRDDMPVSCPRSRAEIPNLSHYLSVLPFRAGK